MMRELEKAGFQRVTMTDTWALIPYAVTACAAAHMTPDAILARAEQCLTAALKKVLEEQARRKASRGPSVVTVHGFERPADLEAWLRELERKQGGEARP